MDGKVIGWEGVGIVGLAALVRGAAVLVMIVTCTFLSLLVEGVTMIVLCECAGTRGTVLVGGGAVLVEV